MDGTNGGKRPLREDGKEVPSFSHHSKILVACSNNVGFQQDNPGSKTPMQRMSCFHLQAKKRPFLEASRGNN